MEKNIKKYDSMLEDLELPDKKIIKEELDSMLTQSHMEEEEYQSDEDYVNSMLMQEVIMNLGIVSFIDALVLTLSEKEMESELYDCLMSIAEGEGVALDSMYMDNLDATIDVMNYDSENEVSLDSIVNDDMDYAEELNNDYDEEMDYSSPLPYSGM